MRAVVVESLGGPEVLNVREVPRPSPAAGEALIQVHRAGVNYTDLGRRERGWRFPRQPLPVIPGWEIAGRRVSDGVRVVGLLTTGTGGYAEYGVVPDRLTVPIPDGVEDAAALAVLVQGLTAWHALVSAARVQAGETVAVTAAAGGVGSLAIQIARLRGAARVIAVASTEDKRRLTLGLGADAAIDGTPEGFADRLREANNGASVDVVLESVGGPIVDAALTALAHGGRLVAYGQASGASNVVSLDGLMDNSIGVIGYWALPPHARPRRHPTHHQTPAGAPRERTAAPRPGTIIPNRRHRPSPHQHCHPSDGRQGHASRRRGGMVRRTALNRGPAPTLGGVLAEEDSGKHGGMATPVAGSGRPRGQGVGRGSPHQELPQTRTRLARPASSPTRRRLADRELGPDVLNAAADRRLAVRLGTRSPPQRPRSL